MRHLTSFILLLFFADILTSCSDVENEGGAMEGAALSIHAGIGSRAVDNTWQANDAIGVVLLNAESTTPATGGVNYNYVTTAGDGAFAPANKENTAWYPKDGSEVDLLAYYPYTAQLDASSLSFPVNVKLQDNLPAIDLMTCGRVAGLSIRNADAKLTFEHRLSKLILKVKTDEALEGVSLVGASAVLSGTPATATWNLLEDKLADEGEATEISLPLSASGDLATAIVLPVAAGSGKSITVTLADGTAFTAPIGDNLAFQSGMVNTCTMTLRPSAANIVATITPWADGASVEMDAVSINVSANEGTPEVTSLVLVKNTEGKPLEEVTYEYDKGEWTATPDPYYAEDILSSDRFYAYSIPEEKDSNTGLSDCMGTALVSMKDNAVALNFKHLLTQLKFTVKTDDVDLDLTGATIAAPVLYKDYELAVEDNGVVANVGSTKDSYGNLPVGVSCLMVPQDASGKYVVTLKDKTQFSVEVPEFALVAGELNTLIIKVSGKVAIGSVTVTPWETGKVVEIAPGTIEGITESGTLKLKLTDGSGMGLYPIVYKEGTATFDVAEVNGYSPMSWWEDQTSKKCSALFRPDAFILGANQEEDALMTEDEVELQWGVSPAFELKHVMGRITVTLTSSDGTYAEAQLKGAELTTMRATKFDYWYWEGRTIAENVEKKVTFLNNENKSYTATLYPQSLEELQLTIAGKTYTLKQKITLAAGKIYQLKADIGHQVTISEVTVADWEIVNGGEGTFQ